MRSRFVADLSCEFETKDEGECASFTGIASTADVDSHNDIIEAGAFEPIAKKSNGEPDVLMLRDHDASHVVGGWKKFLQDGRELHVEGELCLAVAKARETYALMKRGFITGLSVGFFPHKDGVIFNERTGRRSIKKASLIECSIVSRPANRGARVVDVKSEEFVHWLAERGFSGHDIDVLEAKGFDALIAERLKESDPKKPFGDVEYADPGYQEDGVHRYPVDTEARIRAAWSYINMPRNQRPYTREQVQRIKSRIVAAWKRKIDEDGPPAIQEDSDHQRLLITGIDDVGEELAAADLLRDLVAQMKGCSL